jgi:hypothetical protein
MDDNATSPVQPDQPIGPTPRKGLRRAFGPELRGYFANSISIDLTSASMVILSNLITRTGHEPQEIFIKGLLLYNAAVSAEAEGKTIAILDEDGEIDQEISGL